MNATIGRGGGANLRTHIGAASLAIALGCLAAGHALGQAMPAEVASQAAADREPAAASRSAPPSDEASADHSMLHWELSVRTKHRTASFGAAESARGTAQAIDYRLWFGDQRTTLGIGLWAPASASRQARAGEGSEASDIAPGATPAIMLAMRYRLSPRSRLTLDTQFNRGPLAGSSRRLPLGVEFESAPWIGLAKGTLLRTSLGAHSSIALRLRGGKLGLYLGISLTGIEQPAPPLAAVPAAWGR